MLFSLSITPIKTEKAALQKQSGFDNAELLSGVDADLLAVFAHTLKLNGTVDESKKSIIRTDTYIVTGMNLCTSLSYKDIACKNELTVRSLRAESLGFGITTVTG